MQLAWLLVAAAFLVTTGTAAPLIAPGAPGQLPRVITPAQSSELAAAKVTAADVKFMRDMIHHHQQAVDMVALLRTRTAREDLRLLGKRIATSQASEIAMMNKWLGRYASGSDLQVHHGHHGEHGETMRGMLTPLQMQELAAANGPAFDRLFLTGMIQHHTGAIDMVRELISAPDAGEESGLSKFLTDIYVDQSAEIARMQALLTPADTVREVLPDGVRPLHYDIAISADANRLTFRGNVTIELEVQRPTNVIVLNALDLELDDVTLSGRSASPRISMNPQAQTAVLSFPGIIEPGRYTLSLAYRGKINTQTEGFFALDYTAQNGTSKRALFTQFENSHARRMFPCWDEPAHKSTFNVTVTVPVSDMAVSNMPVEQSQDLGDGSKRVRFQRTPRMSAYLLFLAQGDFERIHKQVGEIDVGVIVKRGDAARAQFALETVAQLLPYFNDYFGTPYPLPKLDIIGGPGFSQSFAAMENWGAIFHFERFLLVDPRLSTVEDRQLIYTVIAHELAHQWFGNLVTMNWWDDLWLNEAFASWMASKARHHFHPEWNSWLQSLGAVQRALQTDAARGTHPVITRIDNVMQAGNAFDDITYLKGAAVVRMLEDYAGESAFRAGVRSYMKEFAYANTVSGDLWRHIDAAGPGKVTKIAHDFTLQAGVPLITVQDTRCENGEQVLELRQSRFAVDESGAGAQRWRVPVNIRAVGNESQTRVIVAGSSPSRATLPGCGPAVVNSGQTGYFRTRYDAASFASLARQLDKLSPDDQLGLLQDSAALAFAGEVPMADFFLLARTLPSSAEPLVWSALTKRIGELDRLYDGLATQPAFRTYSISLLRPIYGRLGWDTSHGEPDNVALLRSEVIAVLGRMGESQVLGEARKRFARLQTDASSVPAAAREAAIGVVAYNANAVEWKTLRKLANAAATELERMQYFSEIGSAADPALAGKALALVLTDELPVTLRASVLQTVAREHPRTALDFALPHWAQIEPLAGESAALSFLPGLAASSNDTKLIEVLEAFRSEHVDASNAGEYEKIAARIRYQARVRSRLPAM